MSENAIDSAKVTSELAAAKPKRKPAKKAKSAKKTSRAKSAAVSRPIPLEAPTTSTTWFCNVGNRSQAYQVGFYVLG
jgi:hypothetical protein